MKDILMLIMWVLFGLGCLAGLIRPLIAPDPECNCKWGNGISAEFTDTERLQLTAVTNGEV